MPANQAANLLGGHVVNTLLKVSLPALVAVLLSPVPGWCSPIPDLEVILVSSGGGTYTYDLGSVNGFTFFGGDVITLSGMNGVTGDTVTFPLSFIGWTSDGTTSSTALMTLSGAGESIISGGAANNAGDLNVTSTVLTTSTIDWTLTGPNGFPGEPGTTTYDLTGTTEGPVAAATITTPEPSSLVLMLCGLGGLGFLKGMTRRGTGRLTRHG